MIDNTPDTGQPVNLTPVTVETAKAKIKLELTKVQLNMQSLIDKELTLVYNEDNLATIKEFSTSLKTIEKKINQAHTDGKKPYKDAGDAWDDAKNDLLAQISPIITRVTNQHTKLCQAVEKRRKDADAKASKEKGIREAINTKILDLSGQITAAKTDAEIVVIEKAMGTEISWGKAKYGDLLPELVARMEELKPLVKAQKEAMRTLKGLDAAEEKAIEAGDDQALLEITEKKEQVTSTIQESRVRVEEKAINSSVSYGGGYSQVFPTVKTTRKTWKTELVDPSAAVKGDLTLLRIELEPKMVAAKLKELQESGKLKENETEELIIGGIKFYLEKKF